MSTKSKENKELPNQNDFMGDGAADSTTQQINSDLSGKEEELNNNEEEDEEEEIPIVKEKKVRKADRQPLNPDGSVYEGSVARIQDEDGKLKKRVPIQLQGLSSQMLPPITKRKIARYEVLGKDKIDPLTGQIISPVPPLILPAKFMVFDPFDSNVMARHKMIKNVTRSEPVIRNGVQMVEEVVEDIYFDDGMKSVAIERDYLMYVMLELHPLNESNRWRDKSQTPAFRRIDIDSRRWADTATGIDLAYEAETAVVNMRKPDEIINFAHAAGISTTGRILDGGDGTVKYDLRKFARQNPKEFFKLNKTSDASVRMAMMDANELGLIYYQVDKRAWLFSTDDVVICQHLPNEDSEKALIKWLASGQEPYKKHYETLQNQLNYWDN